eukprot:5909816-Prymnesium_polylepis.1
MDRSQRRAARQTAAPEPEPESGARPQRRALRERQDSPSADDSTSRRAARKDTLQPLTPSRADDDSSRRAAKKLEPLPDRAKPSQQKQPVAAPPSSREVQELKANIAKLTNRLESPGYAVIAKRRQLNCSSATAQ